MLLALTPHPDTPCEAVTKITVMIERKAPDRFVLEYFAWGDMSRVVFPDAQARGRADGLWRHTCFEAFFGDPGIGDGYVEVNLSPSTQWATYDFGGYRSGSVQSDSSVKRLESEWSADEFRLTTELDIEGLSQEPFDYDRLALSAVIEEADGRKSYWALAHAPGKPDFHHPAGFVVQLSDLEPA